MNILVVAPNWIGDAIMAQPLLRRLRAQHANARICVLAPPHVAPAVQCMAEVDEVIIESLGHGRLQLRQRWQLARRFGKRVPRFSMAYLLPNSLKSALVPWLARIPERIGYIGESRKTVLTRWLPNPPKRGHRPPIAASYAALAGPLPAGFDAVGADRPHLSVTAAAAAIAKARYVGAAPLTIGFCPGAEYGPAKRWPPEHFAALADLIVARYPQARIACLGGPGDREIAQAIDAATQVPIINLCGQTPLGDAIALIAGLNVVVSNDSGLMHVAAGLDVPLVAVFGSTDPRHTPPHSPLAAVARIDIACSPCFERVCPLGHLRCLRELAPERVMELFESRLALRDAAPSSAL
ncbi:lipopolysaccharide heptosyltransferase II [soil metagenome]